MPADARLNPSNKSSGNERVGTAGPGPPDNGTVGVDVGGPTVDVGVAVAVSAVSVTVGVGVEVAVAVGPVGVRVDVAVGVAVVVGPVGVSDGVGVGPPARCVRSTSFPSPPT